LARNGRRTDPGDQGTPQKCARGDEGLPRDERRGALDSKTKELLAVAISVAVRCDPCITYHVEGARKHGATREEIAETLGLAIYMGAGPSAMYAAQALEAYDQYTDQA